MTTTSIKTRSATGQVLWVNLLALRYIRQEKGGSVVLNFGEGDTRYIDEADATEFLEAYERVTGTVHAGKALETVEAGS